MMSLRPYELCIKAKRAFEKVNENQQNANEVIFISFNFKFVKKTEHRKEKEATRIGEMKDDVIGLRLYLHTDYIHIRYTVYTISYTVTQVRVSDYM